MSDKEFIEEVFEIAFGDNAIDKGYTKEEVIQTLSYFSAKTLIMEEIEILQREMKKEVGA